jgi:tRNA-dihydrouridine synthase
MLQHLDAMLKFYGAERGLVLFRKHASRYISPFGLSNKHREQLLRCEKPEEFISLLDLIATSEKSISAFAFN